MAKSKRKSIERRLQRRSWISYFPIGVQKNPQSLFIGICALVCGVTSLFGLVEPTSITSKMSDNWYTLWAVGFTLGGALLSSAVIFDDILIERLSNRVIEILIAVFVIWAGSAVGWDRAGVTASLAIALIFVLEIRVAVINIELRTAKLAGMLERELNQIIKRNEETPDVTDK